MDIFGKKEKPASATSGQLEERVSLLESANRRLTDDIADLFDRLQRLQGRQAKRLQREQQEPELTPEEQINRSIRLQRAGLLNGN